MSEGLLTLENATGNKEDLQKAVKGVSELYRRQPHLPENEERLIKEGGPFFRDKRDEEWTKIAEGNPQFKDQIMTLNQTADKGQTIKGVFPGSGISIERYTVRRIADKAASNLLNDIFWARIKADPLNIWDLPFLAVEAEHMMQELGIHQDLNPAITLEKVVEAILMGNLKLKRQTPHP